MGIQSGLIYEKNKFHYLSPNTAGKVFDKKVYTDANGYRVPKIDYTYTGEKNILIIGDSQTFGNGVLEEETFIGRLRNEYKNLNFFNSSVPGYQIKDHKNNLQKEKNFYKIDKIDKILYIFTLNDVFDLSNVVKTKQDKVTEGDNRLKKVKIINFLNSYLRNKSYLYMYLKGIASDPSKRWYRSLEKFYSLNDISLTSNYFVELRKFSNKYNAELYIIILPYEYQTRNCKSQDFKPQEKITEMLVNNDLKPLDLSKEFCKIKNPKDYYYKFDPAHFSILGHKLVFNLINDKINF